MSEITGTAKVQEAYAFACMRCGHGWEQSYEIEHHIDSYGRQFVVYTAAGARVPSPLSSPSCLNCGGHVVRIMRAGQVASVRELMARAAQQQGKGRKRAGTPAREPAEAAVPAQAEGPEQESGQAQAPGKAAAGHHHWHLSDLLHPFHRKAV